MNAEILLQHFERLSEAPDAISRLRRFILYLAVCGKLVEQDPNDEPAADLLKRIQAEKMRFVKAGRARKEKPGILLTANGLPFPVPQGWQWSQLAEIGFISPRNDADGTTLASFVPMTLIPAEYGIPHKHEVRSWSEFKTGYTHFAEGDVGLAKITPCFENGKSTVFRGLTGGFGAGTTELHIVRPLLMNADYVLLFLKCPHFIESGIPRMTGTAGQKRVSADYFAYSPFPLPPLAEQYRIAAKVDELMVLCDQLEAAKAERDKNRDRLVAASLHQLQDSNSFTPRRQDAKRDEKAEQENLGALAPWRESIFLQNLPRLTTRPAHIKQLRQTILNLAVRGKLVAQDTNDEPVAGLLKRIQAEKARLVKEGKIKVQEMLPSITDGEIEYNLPTNWEPTRIGDLLTVIRGASPRPKGDPMYFSTKRTPYHWIKISDIRKHSKDRVLYDTDEFLTEAGMEKSVLLPKGTLVMTNSATIGIPIFLGFDGGCIHDGYLAFPYFPDSEISKDFFFVLIQTLQSYAMKMARGMAQLNLNTGLVRSFPLGLPPLAEQHRIVAKVDELMTLCDQLEAQLTTTQTDSRRLLEAVLYEALAPTLEGKPHDQRRRRPNIIVNTPY